MNSKINMIYCPFHREYYIKYICLDNENKEKLLCDICRGEVNQQEMHLIDIGVFYSQLKQFLKLSPSSHEIYDDKYLTKIEGFNKKFKLIQFNKHINRERKEILQQYEQKIGAKFKEFRDAFNHQVSELETFCQNFVKMKAESIVSLQALKSKEIQDQIIQVILISLQKDGFSDLNSNLTQLHDGKFQSSYSQISFKEVIDSNFFPQIDNFARESITNILKFLTQIETIQFQQEEETPIQKSVSFRIQTIANVPPQGPNQQKDNQYFFQSRYSIQQGIPSPQTNRSEFFFQPQEFMTKSIYNVNFEGSSQKKQKNITSSSTLWSPGKQSREKTFFDQIHTQPFDQNKEDSMKNNKLIQILKDSLNYIKKAPNKDQISVQSQREIQTKSLITSQSSSAVLDSIAQSEFKISLSLEKKMKTLKKDVKLKFEKIQDSVSDRNRQEYTQVEQKIKPSKFKKAASPLKKKNNKKEDLILLPTPETIVQMIGRFHLKENIADLLEIDSELFIMATECGKITSLILQSNGNKNNHFNNENSFNLKEVFTIPSYQSCQFLAQSTIDYMFFSYGKNAKNQSSIQLWLLERANYNFAQLLEIQTLHTSPIKEFFNIFDTFQGKCNLLYIVSYGENDEEVKFSQISLYNQSMVKNQIPQNVIMNNIYQKQTEYSDNIQIISQISLPILQIYFINEQIYLITSSQVHEYEMNFHYDLELVFTKKASYPQLDKKDLEKIEIYTLFQACGTQLIMASEKGAMYIFDLVQFTVLNKVDIFQKLCINLEKPLINNLDKQFQLVNIFSRGQYSILMTLQLEGIDFTQNFDIYQEQLLEENRIVDLPVQQVFQVNQLNIDIFLESQSLIKIFSTTTRESKKEPQK